MATCAACQRSILRAQRFKLIDTECFHDQCVGNAYRSKLKLAEERTRQIERQLEDTRRAAARVESEAHQLRNRVATESAKVMQLQGALDNAVAVADDLDERAQVLRNELQGARNQNVALRNELAARAPAPEPEVEQEEVDGTAERFRLLELD